MPVSRFDREFREEFSNLSTLLRFKAEPGQVPANKAARQHPGRLGVSVAIQHANAAIGDQFQRHTVFSRPAPLQSPAGMEGQPGRDQAQANGPTERQHHEQHAAKRYQGT